MANYDHDELNLVDEEYDDLDDFIVGSEDGDNVAVHEEQELPEDYYEEEGEEEMAVEEEEEPPAGLQEILSIREQLKAKLRKQHQSNGVGAGKTSSSPWVQAPARSTFGTFFGPSTPALAPRLMEAGSSSIMREIQNVPSTRDGAAPSASKAQPNACAHEQKPKIVTQVKRKVDTLRENRDYSNLFSDDADTPPPAKDSPENKPAVSPKSDVKVCGTKPMQCAAKHNEVPAAQPARASKDHGSIQGRVSQVKKPLTLPNGRKTNPSVGNGNAPRSSIDIKKAPRLQPSSNGQNLQRSMQNKRPQASPAIQKQQQQQPSQTQRPPQIQRKQNHALPSSQVRRVNSTVQRQQQPALKGSAMSQDRRILGQKQLAPSSRPKASPTGAAHIHPKKTEGVKRKISEEENYRQIIRNMYNYNPEKYAGRDGDDRNMEAGYASIQMEERRSAKLGRKEDDEQLQMIQDEERRERANKKKKQRAQS